MLAGDEWTDRCVFVLDNSFGTKTACCAFHTGKQDYCEWRFVSGNDEEIAKAAFNHAHAHVHVCDFGHDIREVPPPTDEQKIAGGRALKQLMENGFDSVDADEASRSRE